MILFTKLKVDYFGKFSGKEIELKPGINLIYGDNEAGKSTLHTFIKGMLFGIERLRGRGAGSKEDTYTRYLPWDYPGAYGGQMDLMLGDRMYRLQRSFHANDKSFVILDLKTGREIKLQEGLIGELIPGLTEATFRNTISIEQLRAETDAELASHVRNYITNLSIAKSQEVNVGKAVILLKEQKKSIESVPYASQIKSLSDEIEDGIEREEKIDSLTAELKELESRKAGLRDKLDQIKNRKNQKEEELIGDLPAILEKHRTYQELTRQYTQLTHNIETIRARVMDLEKEAKIGEGIDKDYDEALMLNTKLVQYQRDVQDLHMMQGNDIQRGRKREFLYIGSSIALAMVGFHFTKSFVVAGAILASLLIVNGVLLIINKRKKDNTVKHSVKEQINEVKQYYLEASNRIKAIYTTYHVDSIEELSKKKEESLKNALSLEYGNSQLKELEDRRESLEDSCDELHDTIMLYMQEFISEDELTLAAVQRLQEAIKSKKDEGTVEENDLNAQLEQYRFQIGKIRWELSQLEENETELIKNKDQCAYIMEKQEKNEVERNAINLALDTIQELSTTIHDSFGVKLNEAVSEIISEVTNNRYQDLKVDEKLNIKLGWNDDYIILDKLSAGTIDQVYFALRLAAGDLLLGKEPMPLILDDSFVLYDNNRVKAVLTNIANRSQVLMFSCQMREKHMLEELGIPYNFIKL